ncbi:hypothetical protein AVEN_245521-1, partial [Araneus ventricosus]
MIQKVGNRSVILTFIGLCSGSAFSSCVMNVLFGIFFQKEDSFITDEDLLGDASTQSLDSDSSFLATELSALSPSPFVFEKLAPCSRGDADEIRDKRRNPRQTAKFQTNDEIRDKRRNSRQTMKSETTEAKSNYE